MMARRLCRPRLGLTKEIFFRVLLRLTLSRVIYLKRLARELARFMGNEGLKQAIVWSEIHNRKVFMIQKNPLGQRHSIKVNAFL